MHRGICDTTVSSADPNCHITWSTTAPLRELSRQHETTDEIWHTHASSACGTPAWLDAVSMLGCQPARELRLDLVDTSQSHRIHHTSSYSLQSESRSIIHPEDSIAQIKAAWPHPKVKPHETMDAWLKSRISPRHQSRRPPILESVPSTPNSLSRRLIF
jgi:hypothetical protein